MDTKKTPGIYVSSGEDVEEAEIAEIEKHDDTTAGCSVPAAAVVEPEIEGTGSSP